MPHKDPIKRKEWRRNRHLLVSYGMTSYQYDKLLKQQKGKCKLCDFKKLPRHRAMHVDHNHKTGAVRGLICRSCNRYVIGGIESIGLKKIMKYLNT